MLRFSLLIGLLVIGANGQAGYTYDSSVKQWYRYYATPQVWVDARDTCIKDGANLALPRDKPEMQALVNIYKKNPPLSNVIFKDFFLVNFHDLFREGEYVTDKGRALQYYYLRWAASGNPDGGVGESCGSCQSLGLLNDFPCNIPSPFICQRNKPEIFKPDFRCKTKDSEYKFSNQTKRCYKLHINPRPWPEARAICEAEGGNLAIINSQVEANVLKNMLSNTPDNKVAKVDLKNFALLGFHDIFKQGKFVTVEGKTLQSTGYTNWGVNVPSTAANEDCGSMYKTGDLNDIGCNIPSLFFCEIPSIYPRNGLGKLSGNGDNNGDDIDEDNGLNHVEETGPGRSSGAGGMEPASEINKRSLRNNTIPY